MHKLSERGVVHLLVPIILLLGLVAGVYLITSGNPLKLFSKASSNPIIFVLPDGSKCDPSATACRIATSSATVRVELTSTLSSLANSCMSWDGYRRTFGSIRGKSTNYDPSYDADNNGKINISDFSRLKARGSLSTTCPSSTASVSSPVNVGTVAFRIAETPTDLDSAVWQTYDRNFKVYSNEPKVVDYTFQDTALGQKFIWVDFKGSGGRTDRKSAQIELVAPSSSPIPGPSGTVSITVTRNEEAIVDRDFYYNLTASGTIQGLKSNKAYIILVCEPPTGIYAGCTRDDKRYTTDSSGNITLNDSIIGFSYFYDREPSSVYTLAIEDEPTTYSSRILRTSMRCPSFFSSTRQSPCLSAAFDMAKPIPFSSSLILSSAFPSSPPRATIIPTSSPFPTNNPTPTASPSRNPIGGSWFDISSSSPSTLTCKKGIDCSYSTILTYTNRTRSFPTTLDFSTTSTNTVMKFRGFDGYMTTSSRGTSRLRPGDASGVYVEVSIPASLTRNIAVPATWRGTMYLGASCDLSVSSCNNYPSSSWTLNINITN